MAKRQEFTGHQIKDGTVTVDDLNITTPGKAVITKINIDSGLEIVNSTGIDEGTGVVTLKGIVNPDSIINDTVDSTSTVWSSFKTKNEIQGFIDDDSTSVVTTWSSSKVESKIDGLIDDDSTSSIIHTWSIDKILSEITVAGSINDSITSLITTWSSSKINGLFDDLIDDGSSSLSSTWSSTKIEDEIGDLIDDGLSSSIDHTWSINRIRQEASESDNILKIPSTNLSYNGTIIENVNITENSVGVGACLAYDSTAHLLIEASNDSRITAPCIYLALETGTGLKDVMIQGILRNNSWSFTPGMTIFLGSNGQITQTEPSASGEILQILGVALSSTSILFNPDKTYIELT